LAEASNVGEDIGEARERSKTTKHHRSGFQGAVERRRTKKKKMRQTLKSRGRDSEKEGGGEEVDHPPSKVLTKVFEGLTKEIEVSLRLHLEL
jgi:hypothetical protein